MYMMKVGCSHSLSPSLSHWDPSSWQVSPVPSCYSYTCDALGFVKIAGMSQRARATDGWLHTTEESCTYFLSHQLCLSAPQGGRVGLTNPPPSKKKGSWAQSQAGLVQVLWVREYNSLSRPEDIVANLFILQLWDPSVLLLLLYSLSQSFFFLN